MISCNLQGGLGNQMFQIAASVSLAISNNDTYSYNFETCYTPNQGLRGGNKNAPKKILLSEILDGNHPQFQTYKLKNRLLYMIMKTIVKYPQLWIVSFVLGFPV